jgi:hypothetical protein
MYCHICNKETNLSIDTFSRYHLRPEHNINMQEYYDLLNNITKRVCTKCERDLVYTSFTKGYAKCVCGDIKCLICGDGFANPINLTNHIKRDHKISQKEYYLKYVDPRCTCLECGKETRFISISSGFYEYCSYKCLANSQATKDKTKETNLKKYGYEFSSENKEVRIKIYKAKGFTEEQAINLIENTSNYYNYRRECDRIANKHAKTLIPNTTHCFYTNSEMVYGKEYDTHSPYYKNLEHIIPVSYGFAHKIEPRIISDIRNLCVCSYKANILKGDKSISIVQQLLDTPKSFTEEEARNFKEKLETIDFENILTLIKENLELP